MKYGRDFTQIKLDNSALRLKSIFLHAKFLNGNLLASENEILTSFGYFEDNLALLQGRENEPYQNVQNRTSPLMASAYSQSSVCGLR